MVSGSGSVESAELECQMLTLKRLISAQIASRNGLSGVITESPKPRTFSLDAVSASGNDEGNLYMFLKDEADCEGPCAALSK
jgi:hypothetical protein